MDPLSISASVVALIGAASTTSRTLHKLIKLREVPDILLALSNDVSELQLLLQEIEYLITEVNAPVRQDSDSTTGYKAAAGLESLSFTTQRVQAKLTELEIITNKIPATGLTFSKRLLWLKLEPSVQKIHNDLIGLKHSLNTALGVLSSSTALRVQLELKELHFAGTQGLSILSPEDTDTKEQSSMVPTKPYDAAEKQILAMSEQFQRRGSTPPPLYTESAHALEKGFAVDQRRPGTTAYGALQMRFAQRRRCHSWCRCACHVKKSASTPKLLSSVMGMLYVGYTGVPALAPPCDNHACKGNSEGLLQVHYSFPPWFLLKVVSIALGVSRAYGPELCLRVTNVRPDWDPIFRHCLDGDVDAIRSILVDGEASVLDVTALNGNSLLHTAMLRGRFELVELLIAFGAEVHLENFSEESCYDMAWNSILCFQGTSNSTFWKTDELMKIYPNSDACVDRRKLTHLHRVVLEMIQLDLKQEIMSHPQLVDQPDADGRTPIHWAAARGNAKAVRILLDFGASPNTPDAIKQAPLRASLKAEGSECMEILLAAKAKVDQSDNWDQTCLIASMYYPFPESRVPTLISYGAKVNAIASSGQTALYEALCCNHSTALRILLKHGANADISDNEGTSPLLGGIRHGSRSAVSVLLTHPCNHATLNKMGQSVLHYAALYADVPMLKLLAESHLRGLDPMLKDEDGLSAAELAHRRIEKRRTELEHNEQKDGMSEHDIEEWNMKFAELLLSISVPRKIRTGMMNVAREAHDSDSDGFSTASYHSAADHFAELQLL